VFVDVTERFPFPEQSVDYFRTEHMIEHVPLSSAQFVIYECYRTLKAGGKIRIADAGYYEAGKAPVRSRRC